MSLIRRPSAQRGHADHGWLDTRHSFSFAHYFDPAHMGYRSLRVINEDMIAGGGGFEPHGHRDMEIITYMIEGALEHRDSTGEHAVIRQGEVQRMSAGTGVRHSEVNASAEDRVRLLQIWILPDQPGRTPGYQQKLFEDREKRNRLCLIAAADGRDGALDIGQDADVFAAVLQAGRELRHVLRPGRGLWLQMVSGALTTQGQTLSAGDGASIEDVATVTLSAVEDAEFLLFDLA